MYHDHRTIPITDCQCATYAKTGASHRTPSLLRNFRLFGPRPAGSTGKDSDRVRRERRHSSAGANPARQLSLQPVAVGADDGGNDIG